MNDRRNRSTKSRKNQNARRKGNLQLTGNFGSGHHKTIGDERKKNQKRIPQENEKTTRNQQHSRSLIKKEKHQCCLLCKILRTREELRHMDQRTRKLMTLHKALHPRDDVDMWQEKKEEEDLLAYKIVSMHRYNDQKTT